MSTNGVTTLHRGRRIKDYDNGVLTAHELNGQVTNFNVKYLSDDICLALAVDGLSARMSRPGASPTEVWAALERGELSQARGRKTNGSWAPKLGKTKQKMLDLLIETGVDHAVALQKIHALNLHA